jgi:hypothetical protein
MVSHYTQSADQERLANVPIFRLAGRAEVDQHQIEKSRAHADAAD